MSRGGSIGWKKTEAICFYARFYAGGEKRGSDG